MGPLLGKSKVPILKVYVQVIGHTTVMGPGTALGDMY